MAITLTGGSTVITLPPDCDYPDEFGTSPMGLVVDTGGNGACIAELSKKLYGDSITLQSGKTSQGAYGCMTYATCKAMKALSRVLSDTPLTLDLGDGRTFPVMFDHTQSLAFKADRYMVTSWPVDDSDIYTFVLKLMVTSNG